MCIRDRDKETEKKKSDWRDWFKGIGTFFAWIAHRGYHGLAMPSWERKFRVVGDWWQNIWLGRDNVSLITVQHPRYVFEEFAARPRPPQPVAEAPAAAPAEQKQAAAADANTVAAAK